MNDNQERDYQQVEAGSRFLSFSLGQEDFAVPLLTVREVIAYTETTPIPFAPAYFLGIMNLRGRVISIIDLRKKLGIKAKESTETAVVICDVSGVCLGVVVDSVNSVLAPGKDDILSKPEVEASKQNDYITGVYRRENKLTLFLDISRTLSVEDQEMLNKSNKKTA